MRKADYDKLLDDLVSAEYVLAPPGYSHNTMRTTFYKRTKEPHLSGVKLKYDAATARVTLVAVGQGREVGSITNDQIHKTGEYLKIGAAAKLAKVTPAVIRAAAHSGELASDRTVSGLMVFKQQDVHAFRAARRPQTAHSKRFGVMAVLSMDDKLKLSTAEARAVCVKTGNNPANIIFYRRPSDMFRALAEIVRTAVDGGLHSIVLCAHTARVVGDGELSMLKSILAHYGAFTFVYDGGVFV